MKKLIALLLALVMVLGLVACGNADAPAADAPAADAPAADAPAADTPADAPAENKVYKIGIMAGVTGSDPLEGERFKQGAELALKEFNESGGLEGVTIEILVEDTQGTTEGCVNACRKLIEEGCCVLFGTQKSGQTLAFADILTEEKIPDISGGSSPSLIGASEYLFTARTNDLIMANIGAKVAAEKCGAKKLGVLHESGDFGVGGLGVIQEYADANGIEIVAEAMNAGDADISGQILSLMNADVDAVILWINGNDLQMVSRSLNQLGWDKPVVCSSSASITMYLDLCEPQNVEGWYSIGEFCETLDDENVKNYSELFRAAYDLDPELAGATVYGEFQAVVDCIKRGAEPNGESMAEYLRGLNGVPGVLGAISCDENQLLMHSAVLVQIHDQRPEPIEIVNADFVPYS